jgi:hypothetical protein
LTNLAKTTLARRSCHSGAIHQLLRAYLVAMPQALSLEKNLAVAAGLELDLGPDAIQKATAVSKRQIRRIKLNIAKYHTIRKPKIVHQGRKSKITDEMAEVRSSSMYN